MSTECYIDSHDTKKIATFPLSTRARRKRRYPTIRSLDAAALMSNNWYGLWMQKTGRQRPAKKSLPALINRSTTALNRSFFAKQTGLSITVDKCHNCAHPQHTFMRTHLDGRLPEGIWQAGHCNAVTKDADIRKEFYPQCQYNLAITEEKTCFLSFFIGTEKWKLLKITADPTYQMVMISRMCEFWHLVRTKTPPDNDIDPADILIPPLATMRTVDMAGHNEWETLAQKWRSTRPAAHIFDSTTKELKKLVDTDVRYAHGYGIEIHRRENGLLTVKEV